MACLRLKGVRPEKGWRLTVCPQSDSGHGQRQRTKRIEWAIGVYTARGLDLEEGRLFKHHHG